MTLRAFVLLIAVLFPAAGMAASPAVPRTREQVTLTFAPVVKDAAPAVVNIYTRTVVQQRTPMFDDPFFRRFFGDDADRMLGVPRERVQNSLGSGVIVRSTGIVITNNHVVGEADEITVVLSDRREFEAKIVGTDARSDLAVLQIQGVEDDLPTLDISETDDIEVGDMVLAIGNPFGVGQTVTSGIVSALARTTVGVTDFRSFIQTDAAINPGNSGGALITSDGRLVGINTAIFSRDGGSIGIGFAIPANMVRMVLNSILKEGRAVRAWLGASGQTVTSDLAKSLGLSRPQGVVIDRVLPRSPADRGGLEVGDVVRSVNGRAIADAEELRYLFATLPVGDKAQVSIWRGGRDQTLSLPLEAPADDPPRRQTTVEGLNPLAGAIVANLNPALADELGRDFSEPGVIVVEVPGDSIAARMRFQPGDRLIEINGAALKSVDDVVKATAKPQNGWMVTLNRNGRTLQFTIGG